MSNKLYATDNFKTGNWSLDTSEIGPTTNATVRFVDLEF